MGGVGGVPLGGSGGQKPGVFMGVFGGWGGYPQGGWGGGGLSVPPLVVSEGD